MKTILIIILSLVLTSCTKEYRSKEKLKTVTVTYYSTNPKFYTRYKVANDLAVSDTIRQCNYSTTYQIEESELHHPILMENCRLSLIDSIHVKAEYNGKVFEKGYKTIYGYLINLSLVIE